MTATLTFVATQMIDTDQLEIRVNGEAIDANGIEREFFVGRPPSQGRPLGRHFVYRLPLTSPPATSGDNTLTVRLAHRGGMPSRRISVQDFEVYVRADA